MNGVRPIITYQDDEEVYPQIAEELAKKLPLTNLQWKMMHPILGKETTRVLDILDVDVKKFSNDLFPKAFLAGSNIPVAVETNEAETSSVENELNKNGNVPLANVTTAQSMLHFPFLHLFLVACEDVEVYRAVIRKRISTWMATVAAKEHQDWLILYVARPDATKMSMKFLPGRTTVLDKLKTDYSSRKVLMLKSLVVSASDAEAWSELVSRIKLSLLASFQGQTEAIQMQILKSEAQRVLPGWNYCQYFLQKEKMSFLYETFNLADLALLVYDELEDMFTYYNKQLPAVWFKGVGGTDVGDDSADVLQVKRKQYRQQILNSSISIFDFRVYLFSRQCQLLFRLNRPDVICSRTKHFVTTLAATLEEHKTELVPFFIQSFVYSVCTGVVLACEEHVAAVHVDDKTMLLYDGAKAELLWYARLQLDLIGLECGYMPFSIHSYFFSSAPSETANGDFTKHAAFLLKSVKQTASKRGNGSVAEYSKSLGEVLENNAAVERVHIEVHITNDELKEAFNSSSQFDELYGRLTERAIKGLEASSTRERTLLLLKGDLAFLHYIRKRYSIAQQILADLCFRLTANAGQSDPAPLAPTQSIIPEESLPTQMQEIGDDSSSSSEDALPLTAHFSSNKSTKWILITLWFLELLIDCCRHDTSTKSFCSASIELLRKWCFLNSQKQLGFTGAARAQNPADMLFVQHIVDEFSLKARAMDCTLVFSLSPFFDLFIDNLIEPINDRNPLTLVLIVKNLLNASVKLNCVRILLLGSEGTDLVFSKQNVEIAGKSTVLHLSCPRNYKGTHFVLDSALFRLGNAMFLRNFMRSTEKPCVRSSVATASKSMSIGGFPVSKMTFRLQTLDYSARVIASFDTNSKSLVKLQVVPFQHPLADNTLLLLECFGGGSFNFSSDAKAVTVKVSSIDRSLPRDRELLALLFRDSIDHSIKGLYLPACTKSEYLSFQLPYTASDPSKPSATMFKCSLHNQTDSMLVARLDSEILSIPFNSPIEISHSVCFYPDKAFVRVKILNKTDLPLLLAGPPIGVTGLNQKILPLSYTENLEFDNRAFLENVLWPDAEMPYLYELTGSFNNANFDISVSFAKIDLAAGWVFEHELAQKLSAANLEAYSIISKRWLNRLFVSQIDWIQLAANCALPKDTWPVVEKELAYSWERSQEEKQNPGCFKALHKVLFDFWENLNTFPTEKISLTGLSGFLADTVQHRVPLSQPHFIGHALWQVSNKVNLSNKADFYVGAPISMELTLEIVCTFSFEGQIEFLWEIEGERSYWAVQGPSSQQAVAKFSNSNKKFSLSVNAIYLIPLLTGTIPLPKVLLRGLSEHQFDCLNTNVCKQLTVIPKEKSAALKVTTMAFV